MFRRFCLSLIVLLIAGHSFADVPAAGFSFHFDNPQYIPEAESTLVRAQRQLESLLQDSLNYAPAVYLVSNQERFDSLIGGRFPDWGAAAAIPERRMMIIKSPASFRVNRPLRELLPHELSHLALADRLGFVSPPRWFDEGLAMLVSFEWSYGNDLAMSTAAVFGRIIPLPEIELVNRFSESRAQIAYAQSYLAVQYLYTQYGKGAVNEFLDRLAARQPIDSASMAAFGSNYRDLDTEIRLYLGGRYNLITLLTDTMYFWLGLAILVIIAAFIRYRRRRQTYRRWERQERLESTDFDYGNSDEPEQADDDEPWRQ